MKVSNFIVKLNDRIFNGLRSLFIFFDVYINLKSIGTLNFDYNLIATNIYTCVCNAQI